MRHRVAYAAPFLFGTAAIAAAVVACGGGAARSNFDTQKPDTNQVVPPVIGDDPLPCEGLACKVVACEDGKTTTIKGKVFDPAGANGLYNVMVYIPGGPTPEADLPPLASGVSCETCASVVLNPMVSTLTDTNGEFTLENAPVAAGVPLVVQIGKWRRKVTFDVTKSCADNEVPRGDLHLPKNGSEGDMPQIAVTTGAMDALECLLLGAGVEQTEFVAGHGGTGHVHTFNGYGGHGVTGSPAAGGTAEDPMGGELWNDASKMAAYDMVLLSCEGREQIENKGGAPGTAGARHSMWDYANMGGKIFATHFHYSWFRYSPEPDWQNLASWGETDTGTGPQYDINTSFPKGAALADWLVNVSASPTKGKIALQSVTTSFQSIAAPAQSWVGQGEGAVKYFSVNTPTAAPEADQCGRAVFSDLHVMSTGGRYFPIGCPDPGELTPQQKALEFMFFDLSACVQTDKTLPSPPK